MPERAAAPKPPGLTHAEAASLPLVSLTAWQALARRARLRAGERVLVHAGAGGVGSVAIPIARHLGAAVAATCGARNLELIRGLGAQAAIDYTSQRFEDSARGYDVVLVTVREVEQRSLSVLRSGGRLVTIVFPLPEGAGRLRALLAMTARLAARKLAARVRGRRYLLAGVRPSGAQLAGIARLVAAGGLRPVIDRVYPLAEAAAAHAHLESGHARGKIVLAVR